MLLGSMMCQEAHHGERLVAVLALIAQFDGTHVFTVFMSEKVGARSGRLPTLLTGEVLTMALTSLVQSPMAAQKGHLGKCLLADGTLHWVGFHHRSRLPVVIILLATLH